MHCEPEEVGASALDALLTMDLEALAIEERPGRKTDVGSNSHGINSTQSEFNALVKASGYTTPGKGGMGEEKVKVTLVGVRSEASENAVRLGDDGVKMSEALLPACGIRRSWCPRGNLLRREARRG